jgi:hypothetical protein
MEKTLRHTHDCLNIEYSHLRNDISLEQQVFDSLNVMVIKEVASLFDFSAPVPNNTGGEKKDVAETEAKEKRKEAEQS